MRFKNIFFCFFVTSNIYCLLPHSDTFMSLHVLVACFWASVVCLFVSSFFGFHLFVGWFVCLFIFFVCLFVCLFIHFLFVVCLFVCLFVCWFVCLLACLLASLPRRFFITRQRKAIKTYFCRSLR